MVGPAPVASTIIATGAGSVFIQLGVRKVRFSSLDRLLARGDVRTMWKIAPPWGLLDSLLHTIPWTPGFVHDPICKKFDQKVMGDAEAWND